MAKRPNILLFLADGMQARPLEPGHVCITPTFDRLCAEGVRFSRATTPLPTCSPARASLMTGLLPHNHGVLQVEHCVDPDQCALRTDRPHWAQRLVDAGYRTGYFGKWHIERTGRLDEFGWQDHAAAESPRYWQTSRELLGSQEPSLDPSLTRWITGPDGYDPTVHYGVTDLTPGQREVSVPAHLAGEFLAEAVRTDRPWACCVSYPSPNEAMIASRETFQRYEVDAIELPPNFNDDLADRPAIYRRAREIWRDMTRRQWQHALACYYARITELDQQLGALLAQLEAAGALAETIVIVTADHGKYVGSHGMDGHNFGAFEEIHNIPLIVRGPPAASGAATDARVGLHDLCPTLLELADAEAIDVPDSRSFGPLLRDPAGTAADCQTGYAECFGTRYALTQRVYWQAGWKFVFNGFDYDELYDLAADPHEMRNLAADPAHQERVRSMMTQIWRRIDQTADRTLREAQYYSMRFPAVGPNCAGGTDQA